MKGSKQPLKEIKYQNLLTKIRLTLLDGGSSILGQFSYVFCTSLNISGDYVKAHDLQQGDFIVIYKDDENNRFVLTQFPH